MNTPRLSFTCPQPIARPSRITILAAAVGAALPMLAFGPTITDATPAAPAASVRAEPRAQAVAGVAITVSDLDRSVAWYRDTLDAELMGIHDIGGEAFERTVGVFGARARVAAMSIGSERVELMEFLTPAGRPMPADSHANDAWFQHAAIIVRDMDEAFEHLRARGVPFASSAPQRIPDWNTAAAGIEAFYFRDLDGHFLEILAFPEGKGDPRWQDNDELFLGIDHTAIVVRDTDASVAFYTGLLGMRVAGTSENHGPEQEHLNGVFGARLRITSLRAPAGPAIELLEYLTPRTGRDMPRDSMPSDGWHWHITIDADTLDGFFAGARTAGGSPISPAPQRIERTPAVDAHEALMVRDPDGHALLLRAGTDR
jgi:catechol 2,3-dioxygenase-like lactoylglutathione lyase family enzyme